MQHISYGSPSAGLARRRAWGAACAVLGLALLVAGCVAPAGSGPANTAPSQPAAAQPAAAQPTAAQPAAAQPTTAATPAPSAAGAGQTVQVALQNSAFSPKTLNVTAGSTVVWTNNDGIAHTVSADDGSFDSGNMNQGATFKFTFTKAGTYAYYCKYHGGPGGKGMAGEVIVK